MAKVHRSRSSTFGTPNAFGKRVIHRNVGAAFGFAEMRGDAGSLENVRKWHFTVFGANNDMRSWVALNVHPNIQALGEFVG